MIACKTKPKVFIDSLLLSDIENTIYSNTKSKKPINNMSESKKTSFAINTLTSKVFEMWAGAISENVIVHDEETISNTVFQYSEYKNKESIIIITDSYTNSEINELESKLDNNLHTVIYCNKNREKVSKLLNKVKTKISAKSLSNAITKAYQLVKEGQAIILPKVDSNFEFFNHVKFA